MDGPSTLGQAVEGKESLLNSIQKRVHQQKDMLIGIQEVATILQNRLLGETPEASKKAADSPVPAGLLSQIMDDLSANKNMIEGIRDTLDHISNTV